MILMMDDATKDHSAADGFSVIDDPVWFVHTGRRTVRYTYCALGCVVETVVQCSAVQYDYVLSTGMPTSKCVN